MWNDKKVGVAITTYNSESYYKTLYDSLEQCDCIDTLVTVNGGDHYKGHYAGSWIQHDVNHYPSVCRNDAVNFLLNRDIDYIFLIEDDMIIKRPDTLDKYIEAHETSGLSYLCFVSTSDGSKDAQGNRTPRLSVQYPKSDVTICLYSNMCNEFTFHTADEFRATGLYDTKMRDAFDVDLTYRRTKWSHKKIPPFWYFPDIKDSDNYIQNNPNAVSRLQADGARQKVVGEQWKYFKQKHGVMVNEIPNGDEVTTRNHLRDIYEARNR
jgi:glycosyltransferase involved in cell wall biosynthesis